MWSRVDRSSESGPVHITPRPDAHHTQARCTPHPGPVHSTPRPDAHHTQALCKKTPWPSAHYSGLVYTTPKPSAHHTLAQCTPCLGPVHSMPDPFDRKESGHLQSQKSRKTVLGNLQSSEHSLGKLLERFLMPGQASLKSFWTNENIAQTKAANSHRAHTQIFSHKGRRYWICIITENMGVCY